MAGRKTIGDHMRECRERAGMNRNQAERASGVAHTSIYSYENDISVPGVLNMIELAKAYGVSLDELVGYKSKERRFSANVWNYAGCDRV